MTLASMVFLAGCFGGDEEVVEEENTESEIEAQDTSGNNFEGPDFTIFAPEEWEVIKKEDFTSDVPAGTVVVFRNNVKNDQFTANANITKNTIPGTITSGDYAKQAISNLKASMFNFKEIKRESTVINVDGKGVSTIYLAFEGKRKENENTVQFLQKYAVKGHIGYIITGAFLGSEEELVVKKVDAMVRSFEVR